MNAVIAQTGGERTKTAPEAPAAQPGNLGQQLTPGMTVAQATAQSRSRALQDAQRAKPAPAVEIESDEGGETNGSDDQESKLQRNTDPANTGYERARRAFLRGGMKDAEFRKIDKDEATRRGLRLERKQNEQAAEYARAKSEASKKGQGSTGASTGETQSRVATPSDDVWLTELFTKLDIGDDPEVQAALKAQLSPVLAERAQLRAQVSERSSAESSDANQPQRFQRVRDALSESIPELSDDDDFNGHVAPAMKAIAATVPRFAKASTDDGLLRELMIAAAKVSLEEVGERVEPTEPRSAAGRGFMDMPGHTRRARTVPRTEREEFLAQVQALQSSAGFA